jgi:hypothetical protein
MDLPPQISRKMMREWKRNGKAQAYRAVALKGGGKREVARRLRQIVAGQLQVSA